jgi:uncharacterized protein (TIGR02996 family)
MKPEEAAFLARVCADPDGDGPRLIYADWLDERGDPRGEFIRVQTALARLPADDPRRPALLDREAVLLGRYADAWADPLRGLVGGPEFRRGFVEAVNVEARTFLRRAADLFRLAPVRHVRFLDVGNSLGRLMDCPHLARLSGLTIFAQHLDEKLTRALVESPHLDGVRELRIGRNRVGDRGAERLAWSPRFRQLVELDLGDNAIGDTGAKAIAESANLGNLESLELRRNELSRVGLGYLCSSVALARLRRLGLALNYVGAPQEGEPPAGGAVELESLDLSENGLTPDGVTMLASLPGLGRLSRLVLERNEASGAGAAILAEWSGAVSLQALLLAGNRIGDDGARSLARSPYLHRLVELDLSDNPVHDAGAFEFLNTSALPRLRRLGLPHLGLGPQIRRALAVRYS